MITARAGLEWFSGDLIEIMPAAVYVCNMNAVVVAFNQRAAELWGRSPAPGDIDQKFCGIHAPYLSDGDFLPHCGSPIDMVIRTGIPARDQEAIIERPDGTRVIVLVNIAPIFDKDGKQIGTINCLQDLTAQKLSEDNRVAIREEARQAQKLSSMGQLVGGVAHDFNNLLTPIIGTLDLLLRRGTRDAREMRMLDGALQSAEKAKTLVQRLLAFARRQPLQSRAVDIGGLIDGMVELIRSTAGPRITVIVDIALSLSAAKVDANQLEMAILNVSINARDAMPDGGTLTISAVNAAVEDGDMAKLDAGRYVRVSITDTGIGMDEATMIRAIEPFFSTKGVGKGTGLGLSMVDGLASQMGGALRLSSQPGVGTVIDLWLPVSEGLVETTQPAALHAPDQKLLGRVLLVDDEHLVRASTADMLADLGYKVIEASCAEEALRLFEVDPDIDGVVTDHLMPGMNGVDLAYIMRGKRPGLPVLIVSGFADAEGLALDLPLLAKPFRQATLAASLAALLHARSPWRCPPS